METKPEEPIPQTLEEADSPRLEEPEKPYDMPDDVLDENTKTFEEEPPQKVVEPEEKSVVA